jgi:hypothetical protein
MLLALSVSNKVAADEARWFPVQAKPAGILHAVNDASSGPRLAAALLLQSAAGLAAKSVNERTGDELIWVDTGNAGLERWRTEVTHRLSLENRGEFTAWQLVERLRDKGLVKGYLLYRQDDSAGELNEHRVKIDNSVNVATSLAGLLGGVLVEERLEDEAKKRGLELLCDTRDKTQAWCFHTYKDRFHRRLVLMQDPRKANVRDLAIAQGAFTCYGDDQLADEVFAWLEPLSAVFGWNGGDEFITTRLSSEHGHFQTATDWCTNLPVLMAGSEQNTPSPAKSFDPRTIDWNDQRSAVSFLLSDGDNVQWLTTTFFDNPNYWATPSRGAIPFGWSSCFAHLSQLCPGAVAEATTKQLPNDHFVEWGGGYYYPDLFAAQRPDRWTLLAQHARKIWLRMQANNTRIIAFNVADPASEAACKSYEVIAGETEGLLGILVFQYAPYEGGAGEVYWVKDRAGVDVPVVTARYSLWEHTNQRPRSGTPAKVAREITETAQAAKTNSTPRYDWVIAHAWSYFRKASGADEDAENLPQDSAARNGGQRGYLPVTWCAERLPNEVRVVSPDELLWRIRWQHNQPQTQHAIEQWAAATSPGQ